MDSVALLSLAAAAVLAQAPMQGAPSDEPAPTESTTINPVAVVLRIVENLVGLDAVSGIDAAQS